MHEVYITKTATFLPNSPVPNDEMEDYLGLINGLASKSRKIVLRNNGIENRYYALDKKGNITHSNADMSSMAIRNLFPHNPDQLKLVELLSCGTSTPDQLMPSHGVMVHGLLPEMNNIEVVSPSGVCCSGMHALKYAYLSVKLGEKSNAVVTGSELASALLKSSNFEIEAQKLKSLEKNPYIGFEKEFLRWMLSDGAGAFFISNKKSKTEINLRIDWLEGISYANKIEPCMYLGGEKSKDGKLTGYQNFTPQEIADRSIFSIKQDVKLLSENIVAFGFDRLKSLLEEKKQNTNEIDYFLPHISSEFFRSKLAEIFRLKGLDIPNNKWFVNLKSVGNVGAGSIFLMIDEIVRSGKLKKGNKVLIAVPESSRFSYMFGMLTVC